jgi:hypothetical protein
MVEKVDQSKSVEFKVFLEKFKNTIVVGAVNTSME